eukprot:3686186-Amphidinium_carterae.2
MGIEAKLTMSCKDPVHNFIPLHRNQLKHLDLLHCECPVSRLKGALLCSQIYSSNPFTWGLSTAAKTPLRCKTNRMKERQAPMRRNKPQYGFKSHRQSFCRLHSSKTTGKRCDRPSKC